MQSKMADVNTFLTTTRDNYKWPNAKPLMARPTQPPLQTKQKNFFVKGPVDAYCHCDGHLYDPQLNRYKKLGEKEMILQEELIELNTEMATLANEILGHECDTYDDKMETIYQIDYTKRGMAVAQYIKLMPAVDGPGGIPHKNTSIGIGNGYRDPTSFRYSCFNRPVINPCPRVTFAQVPEVFDSWFVPTTGRTEYQDTISKVGLSIIKTRQQYTEPLPSSRRRYGDTCL